MSGEILYRENICLKYNQTADEATLGMGAALTGAHLLTLYFPADLVRLTPFISVWDL